MNSTGKKLRLLVVAVVGGISARAAIVNYDGGDPNNNLFSSALNWASDTVPTTSVGTLSFSGSAVAPMGDPAIVDVAFAQDIAGMNVYHTVLPANDALIEIPAGKTLAMSSPVVGRPGNVSFGGTLMVRSGGTIINPFVNGGATSISMDRYGVYGSSQYGAGTLVLEHGASFRTAWINLGTNGTLHLEFGTTTVPTVEVSGNTAENNVLDGVVQLDLTNLTAAAGTHTLIDGTGGALLVGGLRNWLDDEAGYFSATGSFVHANFEVLNGANHMWSLSLSDGNQDLVFSLVGVEQLDATVRDTGTVISYSALPVSIGGVGAFSIGADGGESFLIDLSEVRSIDYVQLRKQFWTGDVPADLELAIYTGLAVTIPEIAASTNIVAK